MARSDSTPTIRTVSVKNYRRVPSLSEETEAFSATIYLDGRRAGRVTNRGTGGCNHYEFDSPAKRDAFEAYARAWAEENGETGEVEDALIDQLCEDYELRRLARPALAAGAVGLVLIHKQPGWFAGFPRDRKPHFYEESYVVALRDGEDPAELAASENAHAWRIVPTEGV
jgi:hypothetical protein